MKALLRTTPLIKPYRALRAVKQARDCERAAARYLSDDRPHKLQIGTNNNVLPGWFNVDIHPYYAGVYRMDARTPFPFPDRSFDFIFSEHMIEHVEHSEGRFMLKECFRVLKPGGRIRVATPDLQFLASLYTPAKTPEQDAYIETVVRLFAPDIAVPRPGYAVNVLFDLSHKFLYDEETLSDGLSEVGLTAIGRCVPGESGEPELRGIDMHSRDYIRLETLVLEAVRPV